MAQPAHNSPGPNLSADLQAGFQPGLEPDSVSRKIPGAHQVMGSADVARAVRRIAHEIIERNQGLNEVTLLAVQNGGLWLASALRDALEQIEPGVGVPLGSIDVSFHRDDLDLRPVRPAGVTELPNGGVSDRTVVLVDDVLYTGRTVRAALDAIGTFGRPRQVQLAVMVDRGHRELPLRADYVGKNLPTSRDEQVSATSEGVLIQK